MDHLLFGRTWRSGERYFTGARAGLSGLAVQVDLGATDICVLDQEEPGYPDLMVHSQLVNRPPQFIDHLFPASFVYPDELSSTSSLRSGSSLISSFFDSEACRGASIVPTYSHRIQEM